MVVAQSTAVEKLELKLKQYVLDKQLAETYNTLTKEELYGGRQSEVYGRV